MREQGGEVFRVSLCLHQNKTKENPTRCFPCLESQRKGLGERMLDSGLGKNFNYWWILIAHVLADFLSGG